VPETRTYVRQEGPDGERWTLDDSGYEERHEWPYFVRERWKGGSQERPPDVFSLEALGIKGSERHVELDAAQVRLREALGPYLDRLDDKYRDVLQVASEPETTLADLADIFHLKTRSAMLRRLVTARRALVRLLAESDPAFNPQREELRAVGSARSGRRGRKYRREYAAERQAAERTLRRLLEPQGGAVSP
jgi:hypothetical protein